jgi:hypothetical protein
MSYSISYRREVRWLPVWPGAYSRDGKIYFCFEEIGDNNCYECTGRSPRQERRARDWQCVVADEEYRCFEVLAERSASCCGGNLKFAGSSHYITPEGYLRSWRQAFKTALPLLSSMGPKLEYGRTYRLTNPADKYVWNNAARMKNLAFSVALVTRIAADHVRDPEHADRLKRLATQEFSDDRERYGDTVYRTWRFNPEKPEEVELWWNTRVGRRGWQYCETTFVGARR